MAMVSHLHYLFNPETCPSSIHMLRWQDQPLQCPRCQSHNDSRSTTNSDKLSENLWGKGVRPFVTPFPGHSRSRLLAPERGRIGLLTH